MTIARTSFVPASSNDTSPHLRRLLGRFAAFAHLDGKRQALPTSDHMLRDAGLDDAYNSDSRSDRDLALSLLRVP